MRLEDKQRQESQRIVNENDTQQNLRLEDMRQQASSIEQETSVNQSKLQ